MADTLPPAPAFYVVAGDPNSRLCVCETSTLSTELSPRPQIPLRLNSTPLCIRRRSSCWFVRSSIVILLFFFLGNDAVVHVGMKTSHGASAFSSLVVYIQKENSRITW